jgi:antagonist of KipI
VAIAGAEFHVTVDNVAVPQQEAFVVKAGSRLRFGARVGGARAYVAIAGGLDVPVVLGSRATHVFSSMGGWQGRALTAGDRIPLGAPHSGTRRLRAHAPPFRPAAAPASVRLLLGPDDHRFTPDAVGAFLSSDYVISHDSDRMGFRLQGTAVRHVGGADIISDVTPLGTLQVPGSGQPLLLMADRQTTGGYLRLGVVISADIGIAAQAAPGDSLRFRICSRAEALSALIAQERRLMSLEAAS